MKSKMIKNQSVDLLRKSVFSFRTVFLLLLVTMLCNANLRAAELHVGAASVDITPKLPTALIGQFYERIAHSVASPLTANVVVLESREGNRPLDLAILVSADICYVPDDLLAKLRDEVHRQIPEIDVNKIFINATHIHTGPDFNDEYFAVFVPRTAEAIARAWKNRKPGSVTWGLGHAAVAQNRRAVYSKTLPTAGNFANGTAQMYGDTNTPEFINIEGMEDHDVNVLFFWNKGGKLIAASIDVPCPAQEMENDTVVNADYWHPVREKLKSRFGADLVVQGWIGAAGDQSPHLMYRRGAEDRMMKLRNLTRLEEISRRIVLAVEEAYDAVKSDRHDNAQLVHKVEKLSLPKRLVTEAEYEFSKSEYEKAKAEAAAGDKEASGRIGWNNSILERFENQKTNPNPKMETEIHVIRIGDVVICTNQYELFTDFGIRMQARSKALQTFVIQLAGGATYLPTEKAVIGGGYSAVPQSNEVGPEGGQVLVDRTVELINGMFSEANLTKN